ncbi:hypothetical protein ACKVFG_003356 [Vibrio cholerae]|nr:hypothetical protein [Vibrio cholerae]EGR2122115.1 hypothetical protein [Vibrio cholerae]
MEIKTPFVIHDECTRCNEAIAVEINTPPERATRKDGKRPYYPDTDRFNTTTVFRCRQCLEPVDNTAPSAKFED